MNLETIKGKKGYTSLMYYSEEAIKDYQLLVDTEDLVLLRKENHIHWYAKSKEDLVLALKTFKDIEVHFIPNDWVSFMRINGYHIIADYREFIADLRSSECPISQLKEEEIDRALEIAKACENLSRGYSGHQYDFYKEWLEGTETNLKATNLKASSILKYGDQIVGTLAVAVYDQTLWIRDIAVHPEFQHQGIGTKLMEMAFAYGNQHQAKKSFLMADKNNRPGLKLYRKFAFKANDDSEIQMGKSWLSALDVYMQEKVKVTMDRPKGSKHHSFDMIYPINYGYLENTIAADLKEIDAYVLGVDEALDTFTGQVIAIIFRKDDLEDKLVVSNKNYTRQEIIDKIYFTEQYFDSLVLMEDNDATTD